MDASVASASWLLWILHSWIWCENISLGSSFQFFCIYNQKRNCHIICIGAMLQQCVNWELPGVPAGLEKAEEPEIKLPTSVGSQEKQRNSSKTSTSVLLIMLKPFDCVSDNILWKILKEMGVPSLTVRLRNLYTGQEATVRTKHRTTDWFKIGKGQGCINLISYLIAYLISKQSTSCETPGWMNHKLELSLLGEISTSSDMQMIPC